MNHNFKKTTKKIKSNINCINYTEFIKSISSMDYSGIEDKHEAQFLSKDQVYHTWVYYTPKILNTKETRKIKEIFLSFLKKEKFIIS
jgi:hypothetical protein